MSLLLAALISLVGGTLRVEAPAPITFVQVTVLADVAPELIPGTGLHLTYLDRQGTRTVMQFARDAGTVGSVGGVIAHLSACGLFDRSGCVNAPCHVLTSAPEWYALCADNLELVEDCPVAAESGTWGATKDLWR